MLDRKWIKKVESNIINHKAIEITNDEFLKGIFGCDLDKMHNVLSELLMRFGLKSKFIF